MAEEKYPIMDYVHKLEGMVREAREEASRYQKLLFMSMVTAVRFWVGMIVGMILIASTSLVYFIGKWIGLWKG